MPSSVLIDRDGYIRGVIVGESDYAGPEATGFIEGLLERPLSE
ncbi:MAG TPA: hypothetical protein VJM57_08085 [Thermodesulfobacteriota bacterium]|nr:hypothetical protein [Thermodesulfobacteriota bacterium]